MKFVDANSPDILVIDKGVRHGWKANWIQEVCDKGKPYSTWCRKIDVPGKCYCIVFSKIVVYGSSGKKALRIHAHLPDHISRSISVATNTKLDSNPSNGDFQATKSVQDSSSEVKAIIGLFISEHSLPFSLGPDLLNLCKRVSKEHALNSATLSATSATYVTTHGVAEDVKKTIATNVKDQFISLNLDEATMDSGDKVLNILAQYFDPNLGKCVIDLIGCKEVNEAPAEKVIQAVDQVLKERNIDWSQVISILMDNCSAMRGSQGGVEVKARLRNKNILDIDGDAVHKMNNAAQKLFTSVENFFSVQNLASEMYRDIENSPKARSNFKEIQELLGLRRKILFRPIPTRFLQFVTVAERIIELWDPLRLFYSAYLESSERNKMDKILSEVVEKYQLSEDSKHQLVLLLQKLRKQKVSDAGKNRRDKIVSALIDNDMKSSLCLKLYAGILNKFEGFVKNFQSKKPLAYKLHTEIFSVVKSFFSCFIKPEMIPAFDPSKLKDLNFRDLSNQVKDRHLCVGEAAYTTLMHILKDKAKFPWTKEFFSALRQGYVEAASMLMKLPINHPVLSKLAFIDPGSQRASLTAPALLSLAKLLPNVVDSADLGKLDSELRGYATDEEITMIDCDSEDDDFRIDRDYWNIVFKLRKNCVPRYPTLSQLMKALLTIFSGPIIEGTFNILNDIIKEDRTRLTNHNYEALLMVKSFLNSREQHATSMPIPPSMVKEVTNSYSNYSKYQEAKNGKSPGAVKSLNLVPAKPSKPILKSSEPVNLSATPVTLPSAPVTASPSALPSISPSTSSSQSIIASQVPESLAQPPAVDSSTSNNSSLKSFGVKRKQSSLAGFFSKKPRT